MNYTYAGTQTVIITRTEDRPYTFKAVPGETYDLETDPHDERFVPSAGAAPATVSSTTTVEPPAVSGGETPSSPPESLETPEK